MVVVFLPKVMLRLFCYTILFYYVQKQIDISLAGEVLSPHLFLLGL